MFRFRLLIACLISLISSSHAFAYVYREIDRPISSQKILKEAAQIGLDVTSEDKSKLKDIRSWNFEKRIKHQEDESQDQLIIMSAETSEHQKLINQARTIAKFQILLTMQKDWSRLKQSSINEIAADEWREYVPYLRRELQKLEYTYNNQDPKNFYFRFRWGSAYISQDLKKVSLLIGDNLNINPVPEETLHIRAAPSSSKR